ncbi:hypothetical protein M153_1120007497 [Pseudoloma neurophilia]|uniref:Uncharacterized protein n=1 Tax=Pseudoloma neurophilia TaxID=146866 RepID=A0A0R0M051_9MICR|nr:hypothetical protein M153_1120007497 [Pseudoloma neurophilia]
MLLCFFCSIFIFQIVKLTDSEPQCKRPRIDEQFLENSQSKTYNTGFEDLQTQFHESLIIKNSDIWLYISPKAQDYLIDEIIPKFYSSYSEQEVVCKLNSNHLFDKHIDYFASDIFKLCNPNYNIIFIKLFCALASPYTIEAFNFVLLNNKMCILKILLNLLNLKQRDHQSSDSFRDLVSKEIAHYTIYLIKNIDFVGNYFNKTSWFAFDRDTVFGDIFHSLFEPRVYMPKEFFYMSNLPSSWFHFDRLKKSYTIKPENEQKIISLSKVFSIVPPDYDLTKKGYFVEINGRKYQAVAGNFVDWKFYDREFPVKIEIDPITSLIKHFRYVNGVKTLFNEKFMKNVGFQYMVYSEVLQE